MESAVVRDLVARAGSRNRAVAAGEIPDSLVADLTARSISVAGDPAAHTTTCACSGRKRPCLHHLAAIYELVVQIDEEPALAVALRESSSLTAGRTAAAADVLALDRIDAATFYGH